MKSLAFIDNFVETPTNHNVNDYVLHKQIPATYHMPAKYGMSSLYSLKKFDALVILGSASHVAENLEWHQKLLDFVIPHLEAGTPVLGICFGHQLIAHHYGAKVEYLTSQKLAYNEAREVQFTSDGLGMKKGDCLVLGFAHSQVVTALPNCLTTFARSERNEYEFITHNQYPFWGVQAHPEASKSFLANEANISDQLLQSKIVKNGLQVLDKFYQQLH